MVRLVHRTPAMPFDVIVCSPPGYPAADVVRAAHHAGSLGVVGLEYAELTQGRRVLERLSRSNVPFLASVRELDAECRQLLSTFVERGLAGILISRAAGPRLAEDVGWIAERGLRALVEVTSIEQARAAAQSRATDLIVKGNESGGFVGEETTSILLQRVLPEVGIAVYARGGVGLRTAAACYAAGAAGIVLDWQLALCDESEVPEGVRARIAAMDGSETAILGQSCRLRYRVYARPGESAYVDLKGREERDGAEPGGDSTAVESWARDVESAARSGALLLIGQDACFAPELAARYRTVAAVCAAMRAEGLRQCRVASHLDPLGADSPLARSHGTRYPIVQGPMTRVSDRAEFASAVAAAGGLPVLAIALMRAPELASLLEHTKDTLGARPWGVGILGFVPPELRAEQLAEVRRHSPPFAVIAGGRPEHARELERHGTRCYLHVPSPELLRSFLQAGARRFVFEGRECGGHVGPRTSFVLWDSMVRVILAHLRDTSEPKAAEYHVLFAGGIHDARSSAMAAAVAAPLAERGINVGVLVGTGYLFTHEAVATGAIQPGFQREALACADTILLESGVGHATRCADTAFGRQFAAEKRRLIREGRSKEEIRDALEALNLGRLRIAAKGIARDANGSGRRAYVDVDGEAQAREGLYMIGQVAALRDGLCSIESLHADISSGRGILAARVADLRHTASGHAAPAPRPSDIAIVGLSCVFPKADDPQQFWANILARTNAISEVPKERWDADLYFDPDRRARDRIYSRWGGFLNDIEFDPARYGMPPNSVPSVDPLQLATLEIARRALDDAAYLDRPFDREHTSVIVGTGGGVGELGLGYGFRSQIPHFVSKAGGSPADAEKLIADLSGWLPEWTEDSFAGLLLNVAAGRVANRFDLGGTNFVVDAACATSLAALRLAANELETHSSNVVVATGTDTMQTAFGYLCFSKTQALSPTGQCRTFDESADGIVISEGVAVAILKRLDDAIRDGDRIYAVVKSIGASSDGRDKGLTAPRPIGQVRALQRAYEKAAVSPATVELIEAHGTGTVVGDRTEIEALTTYFSGAGARAQSCALGSVKSMIGHTKCTAGFAGIIKAALALHYKVLPPTLGVTKPNTHANVSDSPFYLNTESRPWFKRLDGAPRRAGVSAFGFGGTNFHAVLEEYDAEESNTDPAVRDWPAELFVWRGAAPGEIASAVHTLSSSLRERSANPPREFRLAALAASVCWTHGKRPGATCLAIVATSLEDLSVKLDLAGPALASGATLEDPRGVYFRAHAGAPGRIAFLFPGQGSQRLNMLADLAVAIPSVRETFEEADRSFHDSAGRRLSGYVFPKPAFEESTRKTDEAALTNTRVAQPALGAANIAMGRWLTTLGINPDMAAGHSYGELAALSAAGAIPFDGLIRLSEARGRAILEGAKGELGTMAAVNGGETAIREALAADPGVYVANVNAPSQTVISGSIADVEAALKRLADSGITGQRLPVAAAFHSPLLEGARPIFSGALAGCAMCAPRLPVYSNTTAAPHASDPDAIRAALADHLLEPVRFSDEIEAMHDAGARIFIEVGPGRVLTTLVNQTLAGREFAAIVTDQGGRNGLVQMAHALAQAAALGVRIHLQKLFEGRVEEVHPLPQVLARSSAKPAGTTWVIRAGRAIPLNGSQANPLSLLPASPRPADRATRLDRSPVQASAAQPRSITPPDVDRRTGGTIPVATSLHQPPSESAAAALDHHHRLMSKFLDTHRAVLLACVGAVPAESAPAIDVGQRMTVASAEADEPDDLDAPDDLWATAAPDTAAEPSPAPLGPVTMDDAVRRLVALVSERTGYPQDMLGLDLDLEADLGVDSIKRVEILSALQNGGTLGGGDVEVDGLSKLKTLRAIAEWIVSVSAAAADGPDAGATAAEPAPHAALLSSPDLPAEPDPPISRMRLSVVGTGEPSVAAPATTSGVVVLTDDGRGIAEVMRERLAERGIAGMVLPIGSRADIAHAVDAVRREHHGVAAVVHLAPLAGDLPRDPREFFERLDRELIVLFTLARSFESDLRSRSGAVLAATALGGAFGVDAADGGWPGSGAVSGFIKSLAREWPEVCCKTIDFEAGSDADRIVAALTSELGWRDGLTEVGYRGGQRRTLVPVPAPLEAHEPALALDDRSIVLITGGARGITAEIARELAERFRPTLVLVGRSPVPDAPEPADLSTCADERQLRAALVDRCRRLGDTPVFAEIEAACTRILNGREIAASLAAIRAAGATVEYHAVDVADAGAFDALLQDVYARHRRIDGVIHGAGVIEDKLVGDKTLESFERVLRPKIAGALTLARSLRPESLGFLAFFSSVSARYGNRGQSDYAAANEVLNRLAASLNRRWPARVVSIDWGPWQTSSGMVSGELAGRFAEAGVSLITKASGRRAFVDELLFGDSRDAEVIWGGPAHDAEMPCVSAPTSRAATLPLLGSRVSMLRATGGICEAVVQTHPEIDEYLNDHVLDGVPVLPAAIAMELMAEAAACHTEGLVVTGVSDLRVLQGITYPRFEGRPLTVAVAVTPAGEAADSGIRAAASITSAGDRRVLHYRADVTLRRAFEAAPPVEPLRLTKARPLPVTIEEAYRQWLFHGPRFEGIASVIALGDNGIAGRLRPSSPARLLDGESAGDWLIDPLIIDGALQLLILWARAQMDETPLPSRMRRYHRYTDVFPSDVLCEAAIARPSSGSTLTCQLRLFDGERRLLGWIEDMDVTCSRALNRLSEPVAVRAGA